ncbi:MAG: AarF/ABC1/UbiB kinase family protein [Chloroflexi bacterium]|nr:AarF/ABC1/UbiB kinase family protein [Chloroflexota bacterium]
MKKINKEIKIVALKERRKRILNLFRWLVSDILLEKTQRNLLGEKWVEKRKVARNRRRAQRFVHAALELGGVLIKVGQYLSARFDLLPDEWIEELSKLQDSVPPVDFAELRPLIEKDFGDKLENLFLEFNETPLASASLGQVHEALLPDGTRVAVKVLRPGINLIVEADLEALNRVVDFLSRRTDLGKFADLKSVAREFDQTLRRELDYVQEGKSAEKIKENLRNLKHVYVPKVYWERTSKRVLTTEFIVGYKITNFEEIDAAGIDRYKAARILANCYLNQLLVDGFFHADPHPGNLFLRNGSNGTEVAFVDFGMVGEISSEMRVQLRKLIFGIVARDVEKVVQSFSGLGFIKSENDKDKIRVAVSFFLEKFIGYNLGELKEMNYREIFDEISYIIYSQPLYLPGDFSFLSRAAETLIGLCTRLSPQLDFVAEAKPFIERLVAQEMGRAIGSTSSTNGTSPSLNESLKGLLNSPLGSQLQSSAMSLLTLPRNLTLALEKLESERLQVQFQSQALKEAAERVERSNRRIVSSLIGSTLFLSGVILLRNRKELSSFLGRPGPPR